MNCAIVPDTAITPRTFNNRAIDVKGKRYFYKVFLPHDYTPARKWPVIPRSSSSRRCRRARVDTSSSPSFSR
jgi:hypothetical protein